MTKTFNIFGTIVDTEAEKMTAEDVCVNDFKSFMNTIEDGDEVTININSCGGSVSGGISIANMLKRLNNDTIARIDGCACSIASVIACACDKVVLPESSFMMIHNCFGVVQGNSNDLRREADVMDKMNEAIMSFYKNKFNLPAETIKQMMDDETWFSGKEAEQFGFRCEVIADEHELKLAACVVNNTKVFNKLPIILKDLMMKKNNTDEQKAIDTCTVKKDEEPIEEVKEVIQTVEEEQDKCKKCEELIEEIKEEISEETEEKKPTVEELEAIIEELKGRIKELEAEKSDTVEERVAKCQSTFQNKINGFKNELKVKDEELLKLNNSMSNLKTELENAKKELHDMSAAFEDKTNALATLNASVNTPNEVQVNWKNLKGQDFIRWAEAHIDDIRQNKIN